MILAPLTILGAAISWPASLGDPASVVLPLLRQNESMVRLGYAIYLAYSVLFFPVAHMLTRTAIGEIGATLTTATGFAAISALARSIGIVRWLSAMPVLAAAYVDPTTSEATRSSIDLLYQALNAFGGTVGEALGVSLFAALWLALTSAHALRAATWPRWLSVSGLVTAVVLALPLLELSGLDLGPVVSISTTAIQLWLMAAVCGCCGANAEQTPRQILQSLSCQFQPGNNTRSRSPQHVTSTGPMSMSPSGPNSRTAPAA